MIAELRSSMGELGSGNTHQGTENKQRSDLIEASTSLMKELRSSVEARRRH